MCLDLSFLPITTERLTLRLFRSNDLSQFLQYRQDEEIARYQGWDLLKPEEAASFILDNSKITSIPPDGWVQIAIAKKESNELVGDIGLHLLESGSEFEIGFSLTREEQGKGFAREATSNLINYLFTINNSSPDNSKKFTKVEATTDSRNEPSLKLLKTLGMTCIKIDNAVEFKGELCTEQTFEKLNNM
eukprot:Awhi_evm1s11977